MLTYNHRGTWYQIPARAHHPHIPPPCARICTRWPNPRGFLQIFFSSRRKHLRRKIASALQICARATRPPPVYMGGPMQIESTKRPAALTDVYLACVPADDVPRILRYFELNRDLIALAHAFGLTMWEVHTWAFRPEIQMCLKVPPQPARPEPVQPEPVLAEPVHAEPACDDKPALPSPRMPNAESRMPNAATFRGNAARFKSQPPPQKPPPTSKPAALVQPQTQSQSHQSEPHRAPSDSPA